MKSKIREHTSDFHLESMLVNYQKLDGNADLPHRHNYFTVLFIHQAEGFHLIDEHNYPLSKKQIFFVAPGQMHQLIANSKLEGWVITFSRDFLIRNNISESFIYNINLFKQFSDTPPLSLDTKSYHKISTVIDDISACITDNINYQERALGALLQLLLIYCNNSENLDTSQLDEVDEKICILRDFKQLIEQHYKQWHKVTEYANAMNITPKHLNFSVRKVTGRTAKEMIQDRIILEAKRLLLHSSLAIKQVALELGFTIPLHFSSFFKKQTGESPSTFRNKSQMMV